MQAEKPAVKRLLNPANRCRIAKPIQAILQTENGLRLLGRLVQNRTSMRFRVDFRERSSMLKHARNY